MFNDIEMRSGKILTGEKIRELVHEIINKFSEEKLTHDEAMIIIDEVKNNIGECSTVKSIC